MTKCVLGPQNTPAAYPFPKYFEDGFQSNGIQEYKDFTWSIEYLTPITH